MLWVGPPCSKDLTSYQHMLRKHVGPLRTSLMCAAELTLAALTHVLRKTPLKVGPGLASETLDFRRILTTL